MDIIEKSKKYSEGKVLSAFNAAIEQAYIDGYNDGMQHHENQMLENIQEGVEYVDLGLPSGTLWSSKYIYENPGVIKCLPYLEASKMNIPTREQFEELCSECLLSYYNTTKGKGIRFTGITGESISIGFIYVNDLSSRYNYGESFFFWLQDDSDSKEKICAITDKKEHKWIGMTINAFMGIKLPVMLVK